MTLFIIIASAFVHFEYDDVGESDDPHISTSTSTTPVLGTITNTNTDSTYTKNTTN
jgi:hypothetical protein